MITGRSASGGGESGAAGRVPVSKAVSYRDERGSGSMLMLGVMVVILAFGATITLVATYLLAGHQARAGADMVALSGAAAHAAGDNACRAARTMAEPNRVRVKTCTVVGDDIDFVVTVTVEVRVGTRFPGLPREVSAVAHAGAVEG